MAYMHLMRLHKPVGIILLWLPTAWALWLANKGQPPYVLVAFFFIGTFLMRSAGCVLNDIADRHIDKHVKRTESRPLTTGELSVFEALMVLSCLLFAAVLIVIQLPITCFYYALIALFITILYPFCKRFIQAPQLILGIAFSMGIPMAYAASDVTPDVSMIILLLINFAWIVSYDTMYAIVDREDDIRIGIHSTAVLFGSKDRLIIMMLQIFFHGLWLILAISQRFSLWFYLGWVIAIIPLVFQQKLVNSRDRDACFKAFSMNTSYGTLMWLALVINYALIAFV